MSSWSVRPARDEDLERIVEIHGCSYPGSGTFEQQKHDVLRDPLGGLDARRVVEENGRIVGAGGIYALEMWIGGRKVPVGGIASLAVAPEARRRGVARALIDSMHSEMQASGAALSLLYPFEEGFYERLGYGVTCPVLTLRVASRQLLAIERESTGLTAIALEGSRAQSLYEEVAQRTTGRLVRSETRWLQRFSKETHYWLAVESNDHELRAFCSFAYEPRAGAKLPTLVVHEITAGDDAAKRALLVAIGRQCDQIDTVELTVSFDDPLSIGLHGSQGKLERGPMIRPIGLRRALMSRGYAGDGEVMLKCTDDPEARTLRLVVRSGTAEVSEASDDPDLELSTGTLGSLVVSGLRPSEAAELGLLRARGEALRTADQIFAGPRFLCLDPF
jgi:predicted acetyltransferase